MGSKKFMNKKLIGENDFNLWKMKMRAFLVHEGLEEALDDESKMSSTSIEAERNEILRKAHSALVLSLADKMLREVTKKKTAKGMDLGKAKSKIY